MFSGLPYGLGISPLKWMRALQAALATSEWVASRSSPSTYFDDGLVTGTDDTHEQVAAATTSVRTETTQTCPVFQKI